MTYYLDRALDNTEIFDYILERSFWEYVDTDPRWDQRPRNAGPAWAEERGSDQCMAMTGYGTRCSAIVGGQVLAPFCSRHIERAIEWFLALAGELAVRKVKRAAEDLEREAREYLYAASIFSSAGADGRSPQVYFYLLPDVGLVKIGTSIHVKSRIANFRLGKGCTWPEGASPEGGRLLGTIPGGNPLEGSIHRHLSGARRVGEWFDYAEAKPTIDRMLAAAEQGGQQVPA